MSPVSRGRKGKKKAKKKGPTPPRFRGFEEVGLPPFIEPGPFGGHISHAPWMDSSLDAVLGAADSLLAAGRPRELEQATAELLGAELHRVLATEHAGLAFDHWFNDLIGFAAARVRDSDTPAVSLRLLYGLASIGPGELGSQAEAAAQDALRHVPGDQPGWLRLLPDIEATGEVWEERDVYGTRIALIAGFSYPGGTDPSAFLFDIDASGFVELAEPGAFDDVRQAADAWRANVGRTTDGAVLKRIESPAELLPLTLMQSGDLFIKGDESRIRLDNQFRARRRVEDVIDVFSAKDAPLPVMRPRHDPERFEQSARSFIDWYQRRHGTAPDEEVAVALAAEWAEDLLPGTEHSVSPNRLAFIRELLDDWQTDHPVTLAVRTLLPEWVRWHAEQAALPEDLAAQAVAAAKY
jgi:hypothetical protein